MNPVAQGYSPIFEQKQTPGVCSRAVTNMLQQFPKSGMNCFI